MQATVLDRLENFGTSIPTRHNKPLYGLCTSQNSSCLTGYSPKGKNISKSAIAHEVVRGSEFSFKKGQETSIPVSVKSISKLRVEFKASFCERKEGRESGL